MTPSIVWMGMRTRLGTRAMRRRAFLRMLFPQEVLATICPNKVAAELAPMIGRDLADSPPIMMKQVKALAAHDCTDQLHKLSSIPTLVVSAEKDPIALTHFGQLLCLHIRGSRYVEISGASHGVTMQEPGKINNLLREHFFANTQTSPAEVLPTFDHDASLESLSRSGSMSREQGKGSFPEKPHVAAAWSMS